MAVNRPHPQYEAAKDVWARTRHAAIGTDAVKGAGTKYLPVPDEEDKKVGSTAAQSPRYKAYLKRAIYTNFVGRTRNALSGAAFNKPTEIVLPSTLDYLKEDATGSGLSLEQVAKDELGNLLEVGRGGLFTDYPEADGNLSIEQRQVMELKARIIPYAAEQVINWKTISLNGRQMLSLVVLKEVTGITDDEFSHESEPQYRVLRLRPEGYTQQMYGDDESPSGAEYFPRANGHHLTEIPFAFFGARSNDPKVDEAPLSDIADINLGHYRNSADHEESAFLCGQPTLVLTSDMSGNEWDERYPEGIKIGARGGLFLGTTGMADLVQASPNTMSSEAMKAKESQMIMLGARIVTDRTTNETAEGARIRYSSENSVLGDLVHNLSDALTKSCEWCGIYMGANGESEVKISDQFYDRSVDPAIITSMILLLDRRIVAPADILARLKESGIVDPERTLEMIEEEVENLDPLDGDTDTDE